MEKTKLMNTRVPIVIMSEVENIAKEEHTDKSSVVRKLLDRAIKNWKLEKASKMYADKKVTLEKAAEIALVSVRGMINYLREKGMEIGNLSVEDLDTDITEMYKRLA
jgi:predicted HTH domain antitoxin